jgi:hypothetical protein
MAHFLAGRGRAFGGRLAIVAASDLAYGLMRMGGVFAEHDGLAAEVFRDAVSAEEWLTASGHGTAERE